MMHPVVQRARETLDRLKDLKVSEIDPLAEVREWRTPEPEPPKPEPKPHSSPAMSEAQSGAWNAWALQVIEHAWHTVYQDAIAEFTAGFVREKINALADMLGAETGTNERKLWIEINKLSEEIAGLRADVHILREIKSGEVIDLPRLPRRDDVA
jgi:hypothetical protein